MTNLSSKKCVPCEGGAEPLKEAKIKDYLKETPSWIVDDNKKIKRTILFKDFLSAIKFVNQVAKLAEKEGHHPNIEIDYNKVSLTLWTHAIGGLSENDFILAAKIDKLI